MEFQTGLESPQVKDDIKIPTPMELQTDSEYECPFDDYEVLGGTRLEVVGKTSDVTERKTALYCCCNRKVRVS